MKLLVKRAVPNTLEESSTGFINVFKCYPAKLIRPSHAVYRTHVTAQEAETKQAEAHDTHRLGG